MTEDEAITKWCPMARVAEEDASGATGPAFNRYDGGDCSAKSALCIGSQCMAWRWLRVHEFSHGDKRRGYCGAFGRLEP